MANFIISYQRPLSNDYSAKGGQIGIVERMLKMLGGQVLRSVSGPSTTIGYHAPDNVTADQIKEVLRATLSPRVGRACLVQVEKGSSAWAWPISENNQTSEEWETLFK